LNPAGTTILFPYSSSNSVLSVVLITLPILSATFFICSAGGVVGVPEVYLFNSSSYSFNVFA